MEDLRQPGPIRVLYVDDYRLDRELVRDALSQDEQIELIEAATREEFAELLTAQRFDVVLSDFNILGFNGLQVIATVRKTLPGVPLIIVTGTGSEEVAVEAMKQGAADYVVKSASHIRRLALTIRTVLEQARLRHEQELSQLLLDRFFELSREMFCVLDPNGQVRRVNPAGLDLTGYSADELTKLNVLDFIHPEDREQVFRQLHRLQGPARTARLIVRCCSKEGIIRWLQWSVIRCQNQDYLFAVASDITDERATEEERRHAAVAQAKFSMLSPREQDVLKLVVSGNPNKAIAFKLGLSEKTIERHRSRGMKKLSVSSVPELVRLSLQAGI